MIYKKHDKKAFSLLELVIVLAILGVLSSTFLPNFSQGLGLVRRGVDSDKLFFFIKRGQDISMNSKLSLALKKNDNGNLEWYYSDTNNFSLSATDYTQPISGLFDNDDYTIDISSLDIENSSTSSTSTFEETLPWIVAQTGQVVLCNGKEYPVDSLSFLISSNNQWELYPITGHIKLI